jgi:hypothetical protein
MAEKLTSIDAALMAAASATAGAATVLVSLLCYDC